MSSIKTDKLTASEICSIIKECKKARVNELSFNGLFIKFENKSTDIKRAVDSPPPVLIEEEQPPEPKVNFDLDDYERKLEDMRLSDPALYEELMSEEEQMDGE